MKPKQCGIYCIKNILNGKVYVGQSSDLHFRRGAHFYSLRNKKHFNLRLQADFSLHGESAFEFHVLEEASSENLDIRERDWIKHYRSYGFGRCYNLESGGSLHKKHSQATILKMSLARKGKPRPQWVREKLSIAKRGIAPSTACRLACIKANSGRKFTAETRLKLSNAKRGVKKSEEHKMKIGLGNMGKIRTLEFRNRISKSLIGNQNWKGGPNGKPNTSKWVECFGKKQSRAQWADELGIKRPTLYSRFRRGISPEQALMP